MDTDPARNPSSLQSVDEDPAYLGRFNPWAEALEEGVNALGGNRVEYDVEEERTYLGHPAARLARYMQNKQARHSGKDEPWTTNWFDGFPELFWEAFELYDYIKRFLALLLSPVRLEPETLSDAQDPMRKYRMGLEWKPTRDKTKRRPYSQPKRGKRFIWGKRPPTSKEWDELDDAMGYDIRGTSPDYIFKRVRRLRRKQIDIVREAHGLKPKFKREAKTESIFTYRSQPKESVQVRNFKMADDLFAIWPPISLPKHSPVPPNMPENPRGVSGNTTEATTTAHVAVCSGAMGTDNTASINAKTPASMFETNKRSRGVKVYNRALEPP